MWKWLWHFFFMSRRAEVERLLGHFYGPCFILTYEETVAFT
jgi:hypothetical protein